MNAVIGVICAVCIVVLFYSVIGMCVLQAFRDEYGPTTFRFKWQAVLARFAIILFWPLVGVYLFYHSNVTNKDNFL